MKQITTEITIDAPIEEVWAILLDFAAYEEWNPFIRKITGQLGVAEHLTVTIEPPKQKSMNFRSQVQTYEDYKFSWLGGFGKRGIFDGLHSFELIRIAENQTRFLHCESFSGFLHKPLFWLIGKSTQAGFIAMNNALKKRCETT